jgi:hypothetical protein
LSEVIVYPLELLSEGIVLVFPLELLSEGIVFPLELLSEGIVFPPELLEVTGGPCISSEEQLQEDIEQFLEISATKSPMIMQREPLPFQVV